MAHNVGAEHEICIKCGMIRIKSTKKEWKESKP
jgi:hypothetical protein